MQFSELQSDGLTRSFKVIIPATDVDLQVKNDLSQLTKTAKVSGFRSGKVPLSILEKKYGHSLRLEAVEKAVRSSINQIVQQYKINMADSPAIQDLKNEIAQDIEFVVKMESMPEVILPNFRDIKISRPQVSPTEKEMAEQLDKVAETYSDFKKASKSSKAKMGDKLIIDFEGFLDGKPFDGGKAEKFELLLGSKSFIDNFEEQLEGSKPQDEIVVKVKFPEKYHAANLAGKPAEFKVKVHEVLKPELPAIDNELAKKLECEDLPALREKLILTIRSLYDDEIYTIVKRKLFDHLDSMLKFDIPNGLYLKEYEALKRQASSSESEEDSKMTEGDLEQYFQKIAKRRIRIGLMLSEYVKQHSITLEKDDIIKAIQKEARHLPGMEQRVFEYYQSNPKAVEALSGKVLEDKAVTQILLNEVFMEDQTLSLEEIKKFIQDENDKDVI